MGSVAAAYGWPADITEEEALGELLKMNLESEDLQTTRADT